MAVEVHECDANAGVRVVTVSGRLDTVTSEQAGPRLIEAIQQSGAGVIVDMKGLDFISSAGLGALLGAESAAMASGKPMACIRPQPMVYKIFKVADLDRKFDFFDAESEALQAKWQ
jgi:anti-anti-sigma factor